MLGRPMWWSTEWSPDRRTATTPRPALGVRRARPVSLGRLVDDVWPDGTGTEGAARVGLTRLRNVLGHQRDRSRPERVHAGRRKSVSTPNGSSSSFAVAVTGHSRSAATVRILDEALAEWRGPAFDDVESLDWVDAAAVRLDELREQAVDLRFELRLVDDEPASLVSELRTALDRCPTRERRAEMLALALYRAGRQSEALDAISRVRVDAARSARVGGVTGVVGARDADPAPGSGSATHGPSSGTIVRSGARTRGCAPPSALIRVGVYEEALTIIDTTIAGGTCRRAISAHWRSPCSTQAQALALSGGGDPHALIDQAQAIARAAGDGPTARAGGTRPRRQRCARGQDRRARRADRAARVARRPTHPNGSTCCARRR